MDPQLAHRFSRTSTRCPEAGFTLVELMVALAIGLVLAGAILITQLKMTQQNATISDTFTRDTEARAAMDIISADVNGSGFLLGSSQLKCSVVLNYDNLAPSNYFATFGVSALAGGNGNAIPFIAGTGVSLNYPATGSTNRSDVLMVSGTANARNLTQLILTPNPTAGYTPTTTGTIPVNPDQAGVTSTYTSGLPVAGETGILWLPSATNSVSTCIRVPITGTGFASGSSSVASASGQFMPGSFYSGFGTQLTTLTGAATPMSDGWIEQGSLIDAGFASNPYVPCQACTTAYYVDQPTVNSIPTLMKVTVNALDDVEIGSPQAVAAGVVSLQVAFGVDVGGMNGYVTQYYKDWASVLASGNAPYVRTVKIAIISRSLQQDYNLNPQITSTGSTKGQGNAAGTQFPSGADPDFSNYTGSGGSGLFTPYKLTAQDFYHYYVQKTEIGVVKNCAANSMGSC